MRCSLTGYQWRRSLVCPSLQHSSLPENLFPHFHNPFLGPLSVGVHPYLATFPILVVVLHTCFVDPISAPLTLVQSIDASSSSSTKPHTTTLSPLTMNKPRASSSLASSSSGLRMILSTQPSSARLVTWSHEMSLPTMQRPSTRMRQTFSMGRRRRRNVLADE